MADKNTNKQTDKQSHAGGKNDAKATSQAQQWPWAAGWPQMPQMFQMPEMPQMPFQAPGLDEGVERFESWMAEMDKLSRPSAEQATKAIDENARLCKASLVYALELQNKASALWLDNVRKAAASFNNTQAGA